ncbi:hypothetical protein ACIO93_20970 [Streptomyces sp. NPDC087903]|uniref:hypothetical protein n=1 Tax=Streptomyces sp. NPDC087903 TaxID=3365819 RepID=UPI00381F8C0B
MLWILLLLLILVVFGFGFTMQALWWVVGVDEPKAAADAGQGAPVSLGSLRTPPGGPVQTAAAYDSRA